MKRILLFLGIILTLNCYSQITFEKGYYVDNSGQKIECLIKNEDWASNPTSIKFKTVENDEIKNIDINSIKEFEIFNFSKFIRATVKIDTSSENLEDLSKDKKPIFKEEQLFLKLLVEGKANLYSYKGENSIRFFYNVDNSTIEQLIYKTYLVHNEYFSRSVNEAEDKIAINSQYKQQLWMDLKCPSIGMKDVEKLDYNREDMIDFFTRYNKCNNSEVVNYELKEQKQKDCFNLSLRPRLNFSSMLLKNGQYNYRDVDFGKKTSFGFGIEAEFVLPFNKNKWAILIEPTYQSFKSEKKVSVLSEPTTASAEYTSVEIPLGVRYYLFLNDNSKLFVNASFVFDWPFNSKIELIPQYSPSTTLDFDSGSNFAFGIGYKLNNKYGLEMRCFTARDNLSKSRVWNLDYKAISVILSYSIF